MQYSKGFRNDDKKLKLPFNLSKVDKEIQELYMWIYLEKILNNIKRFLFSCLDCIRVTSHLL